MGLFDYLYSDPSTSGNGGLLSGLYNPLLFSPQSQPQAVPQPQYDPMGTPFAGAPQTATDPFGPPPNLAQWAKQFEPQSPFNNGAAPIAGFAPPAQQVPPQVMDAPQSAQAQSPQAPQPPIMNSFAGQQIPTFGQPSPAALPPNAQPAGPAQAPQQAPPQQPEQLPPALRSASGLEGAGRGFMANAHNGPIGMLLGAIGGGMGMQSDAKANLKAEYDVTRQTLLSKGYGDKEASSAAMLAVMNKDAAKTILPEMLTSKTEIKMVKDSFGEEHPYSWNPRDQTFKPVGATGDASGAAGSSPGVQQLTDKLSTMRSNGATQEQLLAEIPTAYRGYVKSLIAGDAVPANIGRSQLRGPLMTMAHAVDDHFDESLIPQRMTYARGIGDTKSVGAAGGQKQAIGTATGHFADLAEALVAQNNANGGALSGLPGSGPMATGYNAVANSSSKMSQNTAKILQEADSTAGEMGKLYYGSTGGGVHEREATKSRYSPNLPPLQAAGALEATRDLLLEKIKANEATRDQVFGPNSKQRIDFMDDGVKKNLARVDAAIAKLKGGDSSSPAPVGLPSGWSVKVR